MFCWSLYQVCWRRNCKHVLGWGRWIPRQSRTPVLIHSSKLPYRFPLFEHMPPKSLVYVQRNPSAACQLTWRKVKMFFMHLSFACRLLCLLIACRMCLSSIVACYSMAWNRLGFFLPQQLLLPWKKVENPVFAIAVVTLKNTLASAQGELSYLCTMTCIWLSVAKCQIFAE